MCTHTHTHTHTHIYIYIYIYIYICIYVWWEEEKNTHTHTHTHDHTHTHTHTYTITQTHTHMFVCVCVCVCVCNVKTTWCSFVIRLSIKSFLNNCLLLKPSIKKCWKQFSITKISLLQFLGLYTGILAYWIKFSPMARGTGVQFQVHNKNLINGTWCILG